MTNILQPFEPSQRWSREAMALAAQAKVLSGNKLSPHTRRAEPDGICNFVIAFLLSCVFSTSDRIAHAS